ncbi:hypothetical protein ACVJGD_001232 [Bradyrhizobium sp. USDA 10063]
MCDFLVQFRPLEAVKGITQGKSAYVHRACAREINRERIGGLA